MAETLIALVDGSIYSRSVCDHAAWVASRNGAAVAFLHVLGRREGAESQDLSGSIRLGARTALLEELAAVDEQRAKLVAHRGRAILDDALAILNAAGIEGASTRLRHGDLLETLAQQEETADMIMIGKRGEAADFAKLHLGSNLERIVRASNRPVFVASREFRPIERVLVAYDGGASSMRAIDHMARTNLYSGLNVTVATVGPETEHAARNLETARALLKSGGIQAETRILSGAPEAALKAAVEDVDADLVVMGAYGHSRIRALVVGSTTTEMIRSLKKPLVLVR